MNCRICHKLATKIISFGSMPNEDFKKDQPDYAVLFGWNHAQEIFAKEQDFVEKGGAGSALCLKLECCQ